MERGDKDLLSLSESELRVPPRPLSLHSQMFGDGQTTAEMETLTASVNPHTHTHTHTAPPVFFKADRTEMETC